MNPSVRHPHHWMGRDGRLEMGCPKASTPHLATNQKRHRATITNWGHSKKIKGHGLTETVELKDESCVDESTGVPATIPILVL